MPRRNTCRYVRAPTERDLVLTHAVFSWYTLFCCFGYAADTALFVRIGTGSVETNVLGRPVTTGRHGPVRQCWPRHSPRPAPVATHTVHLATTARDATSVPKWGQRDLYLTITDTHLIVIERKRADSNTLTPLFFGT
jgi:hypothetical protein